MKAHETANQQSIWTTTQTTTSTNQLAVIINHTLPPAHTHGPLEWNISRSINNILRASQDGLELINHSHLIRSCSKWAKRLSVSPTNTHITSIAFKSCHINTHTHTHELSTAHTQTRFQFTTVGRQDSHWCSH